MSKQGKIYKILGNLYEVKVGKKKLSLTLRGNIKNTLKPLVGDFVLVNEEEKIIEKILERKNSFLRPNVSNIDMVMIVTPLKEPSFSSFLLDKMLLTFKNVKTIIIYTKKDLLNKEDKKEYKKILSYYKKIGYKVVSNKNVIYIKWLLKNKTTVITGVSGAGKSSLLKKIIKNDKILVGNLSKNKTGKNTTRHSEIFEYKNFKIIDTPGFSSFDAKLDLNSFIEFNGCFYKNCTHIKEEGCKVLEKLKTGEILKSRYENYLKLRGEK